MPEKNKPLGQKAYGSIGHLPGSRMGPADHHVHEGQGVICCEKVRDRYDRIIVQEKLDGSCVAVARIGSEIVALGRAGYLAKSSPYEQYHLFDEFVQGYRSKFLFLLHDGERVVGEWLAQAHGTRYELPHAPFVAFDLILDKHLRALTDEVYRRCALVDIPTPRIIHDSQVRDLGLKIPAPFSIASALKAIEVSGHGAIDPVEGAVWRVERKGKVDFLAKYVRPGKVDGCYLPEISGEPPVWNWRP